MNQYEFILGIVIVVMIASVIKAGLRFSKRPAQNDDTLRMREEVKVLKERIQVLERIATDKDSALEREIEQLRDR
jgi:hypothetical protein